VQTIFAFLALKGRVLSAGAPLGGKFVEIIYSFRNVLLLMQ
jgi:hypothetical protein